MMKSLGLPVACCLLSMVAVSALAASAENAFVKITSGTPGVEKIVAVGRDFHVVTADVDRSFSADVAVEAKAPWNLTSGTSVEAKAGNGVGYSVKNAVNSEETESGEIIVFAVEVQIDGLKGKKGEIEFADCSGGFDSDCIAAFRNVKITCKPGKRPATEKIELAFTAGHLLEKIGDEYRPAKSAYTVNEIGSRHFVVHGHAPGDFSITAKHSVNGASGTASYRVVAGKPGKDK